MPKASTIQHPTACPPFTMIKVEGGRFMMGDDKNGDDEASPVHEVEINTYYMGQHQVTQELWQAVMGKNPSHFHGKHRPVECVSWYDCMEFCNRLSEIQDLVPFYEIDQHTKDSNNQSGMDDLKWLITQKRDANGYRLPTEAEWEFAARGGIYSRGHEYAGSDDLNRVGWFRENSFNETLPVGLTRPNELGIYDMSGNIYEWCWDWHGAYMDTYMENPTGHISGEYRILRGGSWESLTSTSSCSVASRSIFWASRRDYIIGLRLSRTAI